MITYPQSNIQWSIEHSPGTSYKDRGGLGTHKIYIVAKDQMVNSEFVIYHSINIDDIIQQAIYDVDAQMKNYKKEFNASKKQNKNSN